MPSKDMGGMRGSGSIARGLGQYGRGGAKPRRFMTPEKAAESARSAAAKRTSPKKRGAGSSAMSRALKQDTINSMRAAAPRTLLPKPKWKKGGYEFAPPKFTSPTRVRNKVVRTDAERIARNRAAQEQAGRYGKGPTDAEKMAARRERAGVSKPAGAKRLSPAQIKANRAMVVDERIQPRPSTKPAKGSDMSAKEAKIEAEIRRVSEQNKKASEADKFKKIAVAQPRSSTRGFVSGKRADAVATKRAAAAERLRRDLATRKKGSRKP